MGCFKSLVTSHFLGNITQELVSARKVLETNTTSGYANLHYLNKNVKKFMYLDSVYYFYLLEEIKDTFPIWEDVNTVYYIHLDQYLFMYSFSKDQIKQNIKFNYNVNGYLPVYSTRHKVQGRTVYTALIDTVVVFEAASQN